MEFPLFLFFIHCWWTDYYYLCRIIENPVRILRVFMVSVIYCAEEEIHCAWGHSTYPPAQRPWREFENDILLVYLSMLTIVRLWCFCLKWFFYSCGGSCGQFSHHCLSVRYSLSVWEVMEEMLKGVFPFWVKVALLRIFRFAGFLGELVKGGFRYSGILGENDLSFASLLGRTRDRQKSYD